MNNLPLVTIGVASYNNAPYVEETLNSIKNQSYPNIEVIIVDDCSKDNSIEVINSWIAKNKCNYKLIVNENNKGIPKVCNILLNHASGDYFQIVASDDIFLNTKFEKQIDLFEKLNENVALLYSDVKIINKHGEETHQSWWEYYNHSRETMPTGNVFKELLESNFMPAVSMLMKTKSVRKLGGYDETLVIEDLDMNLRMAKSYSIHCIQKPTALYRIHSNSIMQNIKWKSKVIESKLKIFCKYLNINDEYDKIIKNHIVNLAPAIYAFSGSTSSKWLYKSLQYKFKLKTLIQLLASILGINIYKSNYK